MDCSCIPKLSYSAFGAKISKEAIKNRIPIEGAIEITFRCNLRCVHCYCVCDTTRKERSTEEIKNTIDEISAAGCLWLLFTGGEPFLRQDFLDIYVYAKKKGMIISLFTNGTLIDDYLAEILRDYPPFNIEVSLYGATLRTYEKISKVASSFSRCIRGIDILLKKRLPLSLKTMLMNVNKLELGQMQDYARKIGVKFRYDPLINPRLDGSKEPLSFRLTPEEVVASDMADEKRKHEWKQLYEYSLEALNSESLYPCGAGRSSFVIDPYGNLSVCMIARKPSYDLNKGSFSKGWNEFIPREILGLKHPIEGECVRCSYANVCDYCPGWAQLEWGEAESVRPIEFLCQITRQRLKAFDLNKNMIQENYKKEVCL